MMLPGMIRGVLTSSSISASVNRPPTRSRPSTSMKGSKPLRGLFLESLLPVPSSYTLGHMSPVVLL